MGSVMRQAYEDWSEHAEVCDEWEAFVAGWNACAARAFMPLLVRAEDYGDAIGNLAREGIEVRR
jgi:hypothetical protein